MIKIIQAEKPYKPEVGDLICQWFNKNSPKYLVHEEDPGTDKIIPFVCAHPNPWTAMERVFDIEATPIVAPYECPYTHYTHFAIIPVALLINGDESKWKVKHHSVDYLMDWDFHKHMHGHQRLDLYEISKLLLGSGYTNMAGYFDGHGRTIQRRVMLDNGDALWCYTWEWYNK